ncbi:Axial regulator YABBY 5 [Nymphaea thermarum]|nr:Axial regulator YABBY 5 [Nymphaea thermarum]
MAVSVPCSSLFNIVTVRCGHCTNLLPVNMAAMLQVISFPFNMGSDYSSSTERLSGGERDLFETITSADFHPRRPAKLCSPRLHAHAGLFIIFQMQQALSHGHAPEKRQRVPSAYNQFIKEEIQRIKASNPDISHREAFSTAAKNWAHFPHIHFGLMLESNRKDKFDEGGNKLLMTKAAVYNK